MTPDRLFAVCNAAALASWILLAIAARRRWAASLVTGAIVPAMLAVVYAVVIATHIGGSQGSFASLAGVALLFQDPWLLVAGWVHYLAFDLFIGSWEVRDAARSGVPLWLVLPCLALTFLLGPAGLLLYLALRFARTRRLAVDDTAR